MRSSTWLLAVSLVIPFAAIAPGGCGSNSSGGNTGSGGSGGTTGRGGTTGTGGSSGSGGTGGGAGGADAGAPCTAMDASVATIDSGTRWACLQGVCMAPLEACAADCVCNNAVLAALQCSATGGSQTTCFTPVFSAGSTGNAVVTCLVTSSPGCTPMLDAAPEGPEDSGADASGEGGADAPGEGG